MYKNTLSDSSKASQLLNSSAVPLNTSDGHLDEYVSDSDTDLESCEDATNLSKFPKENDSRENNRSMKEATVNKAESKNSEPTETHSLNEDTSEQDLEVEEDSDEEMNGDNLTDYGMERMITKET